MLKIVLFIIFCVIQTSLISADIIRYNIWKKPSLLDPIYSTLTEDIELSAVMFDSLVTYGDDLNIVPSEAKHWEVSKDLMTYRFELRDDIFWSDGVPVSAHDYVLGFRRVVDPSLKRDNKTSYLLTNIKNADEIIKGDLSVEKLGIKAIDDKTLEIELNAPASYFIHVLTYPSLAPAPKHIIQTLGEDWYLSIPLVSNGPFTLTRTDNYKYVFKARDTHWDKPAFDNLEIYLNENKKNIISHFTKEKIDISKDLPNKKLDWFSEHSPYKVLVGNSLNSTTFVTINTRKPKLSDVRVRQAFDILIDKDIISSSLKIQSALGFTPVNLLEPSLFPLRESRVMERNNRVLKATKLLTDVGYSLEKPLEMKFLTANHGNFEKISNDIRIMLDIPLIDIELETGSYEDLTQSVIIKSDFDISMLIWNADYPDPMTFLDLFATGNQINTTGWSNNEFDKLLTKAKRELLKENRNKIFAQMEQIIAEEVPVIPISHETKTFVYRDHIENIKMDHQSHIILRDLKLKNSDTE